MSGTTLLILAIGLALIFLLRVRRRLALLAEQIRQLRAHALEPVTYRAAPAGTLDEPLAKATAEASLLGFTMLGDYIEDSTIDPAGRVMRWFVDGAGTTFGWMAPFEVDGRTHVVVVLMTHELDAQTITSRQPPASLLSRPPFVSMQTIPVNASMTEVRTKHRSRAHLDESEGGHVPVRTFDQLAAELDRMREKSIAWRRTQPAADLLEADLKSLLGGQYARLAGPLRRRLA